MVSRIPSRLDKSFGRHDFSLLSGGAVSLPQGRSKSLPGRYVRAHSNPLLEPLGWY